MTEERQSLMKSVLEALAQVKTIDFTKVKEETYLTNELGLDSINIVDFGFELENILDTRIDWNDFFEKVRRKGGRFYNDFTVGQVLDFLEKRDG